MPFKFTVDQRTNVLSCPVCSTSMRLTIARNDFGKLYQKFECVFCLEYCEIVVEQWTNQGQVPKSNARH